MSSLLFLVYRLGCCNVVEISLSDNWRLLVGRHA